MYLGLDVGTSAIKAVVLDDNDGLVAEAHVPLIVSRPGPLRSEQQPEAWWQAAEAAVLSINADVRARVSAIGLAGQMHGAVLIGDAGTPLRPAILWNDGRAQAECAELEARIPDSRRITGNMAMAGFTAPKLLWIARHEPEVFEQTRRILLPKDYLRLCMTGDFATDMSDAAGTLWLDVARREWSEAMLSACSLDRDAMPALFEGPDITGVLRAPVAQAWGMQRVPVVAGAGDNAAAAVGLGVVSANQAFVSLGTSGVVFVVTDAPAPSPERGVHAFCHTLPERWCQMSVMLSAASCLDWAARLLGLAGAPALLSAAEQAEGSGGVIFLPYLTGERTPHANPAAKGVLFGLTDCTGPGQIARAVVEGVALGLRDGVDALRAAGSDPQDFQVAGGGGRSAFWCGLIASALGRPLILGPHSEAGPAFGAARLARAALAPGSELAGQVTTELRRLEPEPRMIEHFDARLSRFRRLYGQLKEDFKDAHA